MRNSTVMNEDFHLYWLPAGSGSAVKDVDHTTEMTDWVEVAAVASTAAAATAAIGPPPQPLASWPLESGGCDEMAAGNEVEVDVNLKEHRTHDRDIGENGIMRGCSEEEGAGCLKAIDSTTTQGHNDDHHDGTMTSTTTPSSMLPTLLMMKNGGGGGTPTNHNRIGEAANDDSHNSRRRDDDQPEATQNSRSGGN